MFLHQVLHSLLPDMEMWWESLPSAILKQLAADPFAIVLKLVQFRMWFPKADLGLMVIRRQVN